MASSHIWVCDDSGGLYIVKNINKLCKGASSFSVETKLKWIKVDTGFKNVYAGYGGLVCAIKESLLWVRKGVTCDNPAGEEWLRYACDVLKVIPGLKCVVRKSAKKGLYTAKINYRDIVLDWRCCPVLDEDSNQENDFETMHYHAVDSKDRLFVITERGAVSYCDLLYQGDLQWNFVTGPPNMDKRGMGLVSWVSRKLWTSSSDSWVCGASFGFDSLWCLKEDGSEVWQLVVGQLNGKIRVNWVRFNLMHPNEEETLSLVACKSVKGGLYAIVKDQGGFKLAFYSMKDAGGRKELSLPVRSPCRCIAISSTSAKVVRETSAKAELSSLPRKRSISEAMNNPYAPLAKKIKPEVSALIEGIGLQYKHEDFLTSARTFVELDTSSIKHENMQADILNKMFHYEFVPERISLS